MHDEGLLHRNIKPQNVQCETNSDDIRVKLTDACLFSLMDKELHRHNIRSATQFCAPEVLRNELGNPTSDMWSFGVFAYSL